MNMEWISVKDRLPDMFNKVLVVGSQGTYAVASVDSSGQFDDYELRECENVTHWMPLPEPPKP